jgi:hypothetical protein
VFQYAPTGTSDFTYSGGTVTVTNAPVQVTIDVANSGGSTPTSIAATLSYSADSTGNAGRLFGFLDADTVDNVSFSFTADTPINGHTNILSSVSPSTGDLSGTAAGFSLDGQNPGDGITVSSDFIDVSQLTNDSFQFLITDVNSLPNVDGSVLEDFNAHVGTGTIAADAVPEPASLSCLAIGGLGLLRRRRMTR